MMHSSSTAVVQCLQVRGELVADLRAQVPHWAALREAAASRHRNESLLVTDSRINSSDWQEGVQVRN